MIMNAEITYEHRLCKVGERFGYFHTWEQCSMPMQARGGRPAGIMSKMYGIVEFANPNEMKRIEVTDIKFIDEEHEELESMNRINTYNGYKN